MKKSLRRPVNVAGDRQRRRPAFSTGKYLNISGTTDLDEAVQELRLIVSGETPTPNLAAVGVREPAFDSSLKLLRLCYTAGEPIESLKLLYAQVVHWFEQWHKAEFEYWVQRISNGANCNSSTSVEPTYREDLCYYQMTLDVLSLGVLLGNGAGLRRAAALMRGGHPDALVDALIGPAIGKRRYAEAVLYEHPCRSLLDATGGADSPQTASAYVTKHLESWYESIESLPWRDGSFDMTEWYVNYESCWAFEAAAVCVIHNIDDSRFRDHVLYPKDLADWARANRSLEEIKPPHPGLLTR